MQEAEPIRLTFGRDGVDVSNFNAVPFSAIELPPPRLWAFGKLLLFRYVSALIAPPGTGKTTWVVQLAVAFALHRSFGPFDPIRTGPVWLWNNEDDRHELNRRIFAACFGAGFNPEDLAGKLYVNTGAERPLIIGREDKASGLLVATPDVERVVAIIIERGIKLLIVDPFSETFEANENSNDMMKRVAGLYRLIAWRTGCCVMLVAHTPKNASTSKSAGDLDAFRGGGALGGVVRVAATLYGMSREDAEAMGVEPAARHLYVRMDDAKANMSLKGGEPIWWRKETMLLGNGSSEGEQDAVGILSPFDFGSAASRQADAVDDKLARLCAEIIRVAEKNGYTSAATGCVLDPLCNALDQEKLGFSVRTAKGLVIGQLSPKHEHEGRRVVVTEVARGVLTTRRVHVEAVPSEPGWRG